MCIANWVNSWDICYYGKVYRHRQTIMSQAVFECIGCSGEFPRTGRNQKRCVQCLKRNDRERQYAYRVRKGIIKNPGVGSGGAQGEGENHHSYKTGIGRFHKLSRTILEQRRYCERCSKDLQGVSRYKYCVHHRDHDRGNNPVDGSNWELLCKACHQSHHHERDELGRYISERKVQRPSLRRVRPSGRKRPAPLEG